jgi:uncharacterized repeat protein (TIGR03803 family)
MPDKKLTCRLAIIPAIFALTVLVTGTQASAQTEKILHGFSNNGQGEFAYMGLIFDGAGNLYGTTGAGGAYSAGTVFELSPNGSGGWTPKVLHNFGNGSDGQSPWGGSLLMDGSGNLYGTTRYGGTSLCDSLNPVGCGTVFELVHNSDGSYTEKVLHNFGGGTDEDGPNGYHPYGGLAMDSSGNLYGTTLYGGTYGGPEGFGGVVFELSQSDGNWSEQLLWSFGSTGDGSFPQCTPVFDKAGNLYGTTESGNGNSAGGIVFELSPGASGWTENIIFQFDVGDNPATGNAPQAGVVFDTNGNLYGTTGYGGPYFRGDVFELSPSEGGDWTETILHTFGYGDGNTPDSSLILDASGNAYGTTASGGKGGAGIVYELSPGTGGLWTETILHNFQDNGFDGNFPETGLVMDSHGNLYGTTPDGGSGGGGTVFELTPEDN